MDHNNWAICASVQYPNGELIDKDKPFGTYNIEASTAEEAIKILEDELPGCKVKVFGKPIHSIVTEKEYENGKLK
jgi:hypothetical protein